jgi:serine/threonine protein kinase
MRRGDIVTVAGGVYASKTSAALIVQDDRFEATNLVAVYPFTALGLRWQLVLIKSVAHSLKILPDLRIVHSDLKPSNIKRTELGLHDHLRPPPQPSLLNRRPHAAKNHSV